MSGSFHDYLPYLSFSYCNTLWQRLRHFVFIISSFNLTIIDNLVWAEVSLGEKLWFPGVYWDWYVVFKEIETYFC